MVSVCLPSDALSQHLPSYLGFSYLGRGVSLHGCSSKAHQLLLTLDEEYLLMAAPPDLECGVAPLCAPAPTQRPLLGCGVAPPGRRPWPRTWGSASLLLLCRRTLALSVAAPDLGRWVAPHGHASARSVAAGSLIILDVLCYGYKEKKTLPPSAKHFIGLFEVSKSILTQNLNITWRRKNLLEYVKDGGLPWWLSW